MILSWLVVADDTLEWFDVESAGPLRERFETIIFPRQWNSSLSESQLNRIDERLLIEGVDASLLADIESHLTVELFEILHFESD